MTAAATYTIVTVLLVVVVAFVLAELRANVNLVRERERHCDRWEASLRARESDLYRREGELRRRAELLWWEERAPKWQQQP